MSSSSLKSPTSSPSVRPVIVLELDASQFKKDALSLRDMVDRLVDQLIAQKWVVSSRTATVSEPSIVRQMRSLSQLVKELDSMDVLCSALIGHVSNALNSSSMQELLTSITTYATG